MTRLPFASVSPAGNALRTLAETAFNAAARAPNLAPASARMMHQPGEHIHPFEPRDVIWPDVACPPRLPCSATSAARELPGDGRVFHARLADRVSPAPPAPRPHIPRPRSTTRRVDQPPRVGGISNAKSPESPLRLFHEWLRHKSSPLSHAARYLCGIPNDVRVDFGGHMHPTVAS